MGLFAGILNTQANVGSRGAYHPAQSPNPIMRNNPLVPPNQPVTQRLPPITPIQQFTDELQNVQADVTPNVGSSVRTFVTNTTEQASQFVLTEERMVTAFIDQFVPIPWMHGDQRPTIANA